MNIKIKNIVNFFSTKYKYKLLSMIPVINENEYRNLYIEISKNKIDFSRHTEKENNELEINLGMIDVFNDYNDIYKGYDIIDAEEKGLIGTEIILDAIKYFNKNFDLKKFLYEKIKKLSDNKVNEIYDILFKGE